MVKRKVPAWLVVGVIVTILAVLAVGTRIYTAQERAMRQQAEHMLEAIAQLKLDQITWWRQERLGDAAVLAENPWLAESVAQWIAQPTETEEARIRRRLEALHTNYGYTAVWVTDLDGRPLLHVGETPPELDAPVIDLLPRALEEGQPLMTDLYLPSESGDPYLGLIVPLNVAAEGASRPVAAVILQMHAQDFLYPLIQYWPTPSETAETYLVRREGDRALALSDLRSMEGAALRYSEPITRTNLPGVQAALGTSGVVYGEDYRGAEVIAVALPVPDTGWHVLAKADLDEVMAGWRARSQLGIALAVVGTLALIAMGAALWHGQLTTHYQALLAAQAAQHESEARYRATLMSVGDGVIATDADGMVRIMNPVAEELTGWTEAEAAGHPLNEVFPIINEETRAQVENPVSRVLREGHVVGLANHTLLLHRDGRARPIADSAAPIRDADGTVTGVVLVFRDRTAEREAQRALRESEKRYRNLFEGHSATKLLIDPETGRIVDANQAAADFYGWTREQLRTMHIDQINTLSPEEVHAAIEDVCVNQRVHFDFRHRMADGSVRDVSVYSSRIETPDGPLLHSIIHDVTEQKRAEAALRESEERYRTLVQSAPDAICVETGGRYAYLNPAAVTLLGAESAEQLLGQAVLEYIDAAYQDAAREGLHRVNDLSQPLPTMEQVWRRVDGTPAEVEATAAPIVYQGRPGAIIFARDISERKNMEAQLRQAQKMEAVGRLAGGVAHDFNNMLQVILGNADMALDLVPSDGPLHEHLEEIYQAGRRSADLTRQLLAFARKGTVLPRVLDPNDTIGGMLRMLQRLVGEEISLVWIPGAEVGAIKIDPTQLDLILANLVVNARDAIEGVGQVTIETTNVEIDAAYAASHPDSRPGRYVRLSVTDDGCGMDRETVSRLFEPFFTTKPVGEGTGLGLATIYGIVHQNQGFVSVSSEPGRGSTFCVYLPYHAAKLLPTEPTAPPDDLPRGQGTVLLVEDDDSLRVLAERILKQLGYSVLLAATPQAALELSATHHGEIALLVTDVVMPQMNGRDLAQLLQADRPGLRCLYMSGYVANVVSQQCVVEGDTPFLRKPFTVQELAIKVREALEGGIA